MSCNNAAAALSPVQQAYLLALARRAIHHGLAHGTPLAVDTAALDPALTRRQASFVTLELDGCLRGCVGSLQARRPLAEDVAANAYAAAFRDTRFAPVRESELDRLALHVSLLTPAEAMHFSSEADLIAQLQPGIDGLILEEGNRRGTFLPSVWESLPDSAAFLQHLKNKAGLPKNYWSDTLRISRYRTDVLRGPP